MKKFIGMIVMLALGMLAAATVPTNIETAKTNAAPAAADMAATATTGTFTAERTATAANPTKT